MPDREYCPARFPLTGHQCEMWAGHDGGASDPLRHHDRIMSSDWLRWCDYPLTCEEPDCDIGLVAHRKDAKVAAITADLKLKGYL